MDYVGLGVNVHEGKMVEPRLNDRQNVSQPRPWAHPRRNGDDELVDGLAAIHLGT